MIEGSNIYSTDISTSCNDTKKQSKKINKLEALRLDIMRKKKGYMIPWPTTKGERVVTTHVFGNSTYYPHDFPSIIFPFLLFIYLFIKLV